MTVTADPAKDTAPLVEVLRDAHGRGSDPRGAVTIELDGTGRVVSVEVTSTAMDGNRGAMERAIHAALDAAWVEVEQARREALATVKPVLDARTAALTSELRAFGEQASAQLERTLAAVSAAVERAGGTS